MVTIVKDKKCLFKIKEKFVCHRVVRLNNTSMLKIEFATTNLAQKEPNSSKIRISIKINVYLVVRKLRDIIKTEMNVLHSARIIIIIQTQTMKKFVQKILLVMLLL